MRGPNEFLLALRKEVALLSVRIPVAYVSADEGISLAWNYTRRFHVVVMTAIRRSRNLPSRSSRNARNVKVERVPGLIDRCNITCGIFFFHVEMELHSVTVPANTLERFRFRTRTRN